MPRNSPVKQERAAANATVVAHNAIHPGVAMRANHEYGLRTKEQQNEHVAHWMAKAPFGTMFILDGPTLETSRFLVGNGIPPQRIFVVDFNPAQHTRTRNSSTLLTGLNIVTGDIDAKIQEFSAQVRVPYITGVYLDTCSTVYGQRNGFQPLATAQRIFASGRLIDGAVFALTLVRRGVKDAHLVAHEEIKKIAEGNGFKLELLEQQLYMSKPRRDHNRGSAMALLIYKVRRTPPHGYALRPRVRRGVYDTIPSEEHFQAAAALTLFGEPIGHAVHVAPPSIARVPSPTVAPPSIVRVPSPVVAPSIVRVPSPAVAPPSIVRVPSPVFSPPIVYIPPPPPPPAGPPATILISGVPRPVYVGPRGGLYYFTPSGRKAYLPR